MIDPYMQRIEMKGKSLLVNTVIFILGLLFFGYIFYIFFDKFEGSNKLIMAYWAFAISNSGSATNWITSIIGYFISKPNIRMEVSTIPTSNNLQCDFYCFNQYDYPICVEGISSDEYSAIAIKYPIEPKKSYKGKFTMIFNNVNVNVKIKRTLKFKITYKDVDSKKSKTIIKRIKNPFFTKCEEK